MIYLYLHLLVSFVTTVSLELSLSQDKTYVVIPCTFRPGQEGKFSINFTCVGTLKITPLPPNKEWKCITGKVGRQFVFAKCKSVRNSCNFVLYFRENGEAKLQVDAATMQVVVIILSFLSVRERLRQQQFSYPKLQRKSLMQLDSTF